MVGQRPLEAFIGVRIPAPQLVRTRFNIRISQTNT